MATNETADISGSEKRIYREKEETWTKQQNGVQREKHFIDAKMNVFWNVRLCL